MMSRRGSRTWPTYMHWWASGDELPSRTPDWLLNLWPCRALNRLVCLAFGHELDQDSGVTFCVWCQHISSETA